MEPPVLRRWSHAERPADAALEAIFRAEGLSPSWWVTPGATAFPQHIHEAAKLLFVASGSITFIVGAGERLEMGPGDRLDLPAGFPHSALAGPGGVRCVEAFRG